MGVPFGANKINPYPCTDAEVSRNFQVIINQFEEITEGGGVDAFKVAVNADDFPPTYAGPNYLFPKLVNQSTFDEEAHQLVYAEVVDDSGDLKVNLFTALSEGGGGGGDDHKVLVSGTDSTFEYLFTSMKDAGTYASGTDVLVMSEVADASANEKLRCFIRIDEDLVEKFWNNVIIIGGSYSDGTLEIDAVEKKRLIRGRATANVLAGAATFNIDGIELLSGSIDPRTVPGSPTETLAIHKEDIKAALRNDDWITAVYNDADSQWEWLCTERYRAIRGEYVSGTATLTIDNVVVLDSGLDPRTDTTSATETVEVDNPLNSKYAIGAIVEADYDSANGKWIASEGGGGGLSATMMVLTEAIDAATGDEDEITPAEADAQPYETDGAGVRTKSGDPITVRNYDTCQGWPARTLVYVVSTDGGAPEIVAASCCQLDEGAA